jgi:hypothetical protein
MATKTKRRVKGEIGMAASTNGRQITLDPICALNVLMELREVEINNPLRLSRAVDRRRSAERHEVPADVRCWRRQQVAHIQIRRPELLRGLWGHDRTDGRGDRRGGCGDAGAGGLKGRVAVMAKMIFNEPENSANRAGPELAGWINGD